MEEKKITGGGRVYLRVNEFEISKFIEAKKIDISAKMIIQAICQQSAGIEIKVFDKKKKRSITLPKNFLCKKVKLV